MVAAGKPVDGPSLLNETRILASQYVKAEIAKLPPGTPVILSFQSHGSPHGFAGNPITGDGGILTYGPNAPLVDKATPGFELSARDVAEYVLLDLRGDMGRGLVPKTIQVVILNACASERFNNAITAALKLPGVKYVVSTTESTWPSSKTLEAGTDTDDAGKVWQSKGKIAVYTPGTGTATSTTEGVYAPGNPFSGGDVGGKVDGVGSRTTYTGGKGATWGVEQIGSDLLAGKTPKPVKTQ